MELRRLDAKLKQIVAVGAGRHPLKIHQPAMQIAGYLYLRRQHIPVEHVVGAVHRYFPGLRQIKVKVSADI